MGDLFKLPYLYDIKVDIAERYRGSRSNVATVSKVLWCFWVEVSVCGLEAPSLCTRFHWQWSRARAWAGTIRLAG